MNSSVGNLYVPESSKGLFFFS
uniref:Uncharacterized protein n=1 Tax=Rhizophora mucronata TaxID=61149 RepID=A0A2P2P2Y5_RHIMU